MPGQLPLPAAATGPLHLVSDVEPAREGHCNIFITTASSSADRVEARHANCRARLALENKMLIELFILTSAKLS
jgi:hypothetical protein